MIGKAKRIIEKFQNKIEVLSRVDELSKLQNLQWNKLGRMEPPENVTLLVILKSGKSIIGEFSKCPLGEFWNVDTRHIHRGSLSVAVATRNDKWCYIDEIN